MDVILMPAVLLLRLPLLLCAGIAVKVGIQGGTIRASKGVGSHDLAPSSLVLLAEVI
jgi:hypothetical protein